jgi:DNA replication protein DnaD
MATGYIKLHRQIQENEYYFREPFSRTMAWIDLLLLANHKKKTVRLRGILVTIERGQLAYSIETLSKRWQRNRKTVMKWLEEFSMDNMLDTKKDNVTTLITIRNYELYQGRLDTKEDSKLDSKRDTNNNDKNEKNTYIDSEHPEKTPSKVTYSDSFNTFWNTYPKRKDKATAYKVWEKIGVSNGMLETILKAVEEQIVCKQWQDPQFIPLPSTWLNKRRWEDEETPVKQLNAWETPL